MSNVLVFYGACGEYVAESSIEINSVEKVSKAQGHYVVHLSVQWMNNFP